MTSGECPAPCKGGSPDLGARIAECAAEAIEDMGISLARLPDSEAEFIKMCEMLDAWLWCKQHRPDIVGRRDWLDMQWVMAGLAENLGQTAKFLALVEAK